MKETDKWVPDQDRYAGELERKYYSTIQNILLLSML